MKEVEGMGFCYFYNMTNQPITLTVNYQPAAAVIPALPTTAPYTPNISAGYELYNTTQPQPGQIGSHNTLTAVLSGGEGGSVNVMFQIDMSVYPVTSTIIVYMFYNSMVAEAITDANAYVGPNGGTLIMSDTSPNQHL
jgi:hypothetical protein